MSAALDLNRGDRVEVHSRSQGPHQWIGGVVFKLAGKGAYVETDAGHENFFRWKDIRIVKPESQKPGSSRRIVSAQRHTTVVEVARPARPVEPVTLRSTTALSSAVVPGVPVPPAPPPPARPSLPAKPLPGPRPLTASLGSISGSEPRAASREPRDSSGRQSILMDLHPGAQTRNVPRKLHDPTPVGNAFRAYRLRQGLSQIEMADRLSVPGSTLSQIELGDMVPNDDLILAFAEETGTPLDELIHLRENSRMPPKSSVAVLPPPPAPSPPPPPAPLPTPPKPVLRPFSEVVVAVEAIVPMPSDAAKRARWLQVVAELYELREPPQ